MGVVLFQGEMKSKKGTDNICGRHQAIRNACENLTDSLEQAPRGTDSAKGLHSWYSVRGLTELMIG